MAQRSNILAFLNDLLEPEKFHDYGPNGLQVPGKSEIHTVVSGVSACQALFERALEQNADLILVHHGLFWKNLPLALSPIMAKRLRTLLTHELNLVAYHLPLDAHPEHGNNARIAQQLHLRNITPFGLYNGQPIGCMGVTPQPLGFPELLEQVETITKRQALSFRQGPEEIKRIAIVSGGGSSSLYEALQSNCDALITGEPTEWVMNIANEGKIHYIAAGHYATETFGVQRIGELLAKRFDLDHFFVDVENPV